jgi:hypothetical protein
MHKNVPALRISKCLDRAQVIRGYPQAVVFPQRRMVNNAFLYLTMKKGVFRDWSCHRVKSIPVQLRGAHGRTSASHSEYGRLDQAQGFREYQMLIWRISRGVEFVG